MKQLVYILIILFLFAISSCTQNPEKDAINDFNAFLGTEKAEAMDIALDSFEKFLELNYPDAEDQTKRTKLFLQQLENDYRLDSSWVFARSENKEIMRIWEGSGLRKELWLHGYELDTQFPSNDFSSYPNEPFNHARFDSLYDIGEVDWDHIEAAVSFSTEWDSAEVVKRFKKREERNLNSLYGNPEGIFTKGLAMFGTDDEMVKGYVEIQSYTSGPLPGVLIGGLLSDENDVNLNNPFIRRIILVEIYYPLMHQDVDE